MPLLTPRAIRVSENGLLAAALWWPKTMLLTLKEASPEDLRKLRQGWIFAPQFVLYSVTPGGCWIPLNRKFNKEGYPNGLHRRVFKQFVCPIPTGACIMHSCDNPSCINPAHLNPGSHTDNFRDMTDKGRRAQGENNGRAKLTARQAKAIRKSEDSVSSLARKYQVSRRVIGLIRQGKIWKGV